MNYLEFEKALKIFPVFLSVTSSFSIFFFIVRSITDSTVSTGFFCHIFGISIAAAILTPSPDVGTMLMLGVPMALLFEAGLCFVEVPPFAG